MTLKTLIAETIAEARRHGYTSADAAYELTEYDCDSIVCDLGRKPSRSEWAEAGYPYVGSAHIQVG